jgi:hypothetical protein
LGPAGENQKLAKYAGSSDSAILQPIDFEFRSHDTPQYNSLVQLIFLYLPEKVHSMRGGAKVLDGMHHNVALEDKPCATQQDGLVVVEIGDKNATGDVHVFGVNP